MTRSTTRRAAVAPKTVGRRSALRAVPRPLAGAALAVAAGLLLTGCSAGQIAETARKNPSVPGANADTQLIDAAGAVIGSVAVRDVVVAYNGSQGYARGGSAPLEARVFNDTTEPVTVRVVPARRAPGAASGQVVEAGAVTLLGGAVPSASPTSAPLAGAAESATAAGTSTAGTPAAGTPTAGTSAAGDATTATGAPTSIPGGTDAGSTPATFGIPAGGFVVLSQHAGRVLQVTDLSDQLIPGTAVPVLFQFSNGLELAVTAPVTVPLSPPARATPEGEDLRGGH